MMMMMMMMMTAPTTRALGSTGRVYYIHVRSGRSQLVHPNIMEVAEHASNKRSELEARADEEMRGARQHVAEVMAAVAHEHGVILRTLTRWRRSINATSSSP